MKTPLFALLLLLCATLFIVFLTTRPEITPQECESYTTARALVEQYFDEITEMFIRYSNRPHDNIDQNLLSIGHGIRMVEIRPDYRDVFRQTKHIRDIFLPSYDWLFIITHDNNSRGHIIVRYIDGEHKLYWPELHENSHNEYGGFEMSSRLFWHFDDILESYAEVFDISSTVIFDNSQWFLLINSDHNAIELCQWNTLGAMRRGEPLIMNGGTIAEMLEIDMSRFDVTLNRHYISGMYRYQLGMNYINLGVRSLYRLHTGPILIEPAPAPRINEDISLEILDVSGTNVTVAIVNQSVYDISADPNFSVDHFDGNEWLLVRWLRSYAGSVGIPISANETRYLNKNLLNVYPIEPGLYRLRKNFIIRADDGLSWWTRRHYDVVAEFYFEGR